MHTVALPVVSAITAGALLIGQMVLALAVVAVRRRSGPSLGDGGNPALTAAIRRHGNYAENAAIFVAGLALLEMMGAVRPFVIGLAALFIAGRIAHAIGLSLPKTLNVWRIGGVFATVAACVTLGVRLITLAAGLLG
jgi:uncharacterized membrane protein YecN with MAPEG domain